MKRLGKLIFFIGTGIALGALTTACSGSHVQTHAGVDVVWGSHGPKVVPSLGVDLYNGGRY